MSLIEVFKQFDINGDGYITQAELKECLKKQEIFISDDEADSMIQTADKNGDGKVNYTEFAKMLETK